MKSSLRVKFKYIDEWNSRRAIIARLYLGTNNSHCYELILPMTGKGSIHVWHLFTLKLNRHDELNLYLNKRGVARSFIILSLFTDRRPTRN